MSNNSQCLMSQTTSANHLTEALNVESVRQDKEGMYCLNDLWKAAGSPEYKEPKRFTQLDMTKELVEILKLKDVSNVFIKTKRGKGGGSYGNQQILVAYAKYLSPEIHALVLQTFIERVEEENDPELALERGLDRSSRGYLKQGKSTDWIDQRQLGIVTRKVFTRTLQVCGVAGRGFSLCTDAVTLPVCGTARERLEDAGLPKGTNSRNHMTKRQLAIVNLIETIAAEELRKLGVFGNRECQELILKISRQAAKNLEVSA